MTRPVFSSIAVVGVSADPSKYGHRVFKDLLIARYPVVAVNPKGGTIERQTVYPTLSALPQTPELVITVVPPTVTEAIVQECHSLKVKEIWMQPGSESAAAIQKATALGIKVTSNACFMKHQGIW